MKGTVKWFDVKKGYGFISRNNGEDVFVHHTDILTDGYCPHENDEVEFEIEQGKKGPQAVRVVLVNEGKRE